LKVDELLNPWSVTPTGPAAQYLERLARELDVPLSRYEEAARRYDSLGRWLCRDDSTLKDLSPDVYVQGSFRLGTPIRPVNDDEHYDIDLVCELAASKTATTQQQLKEMLGHEMRLYAQAHNMQEVSEGRRCWTLEYAEGAQFHLDALPALPDGERKRQLLVEANLNADWASTAIAITDNEHLRYWLVSEQWPHSNPLGYTNWFRSRMETSYRQIREALALEAKASVEDIPSYAVKTPLQQAVQILKRHRDIMFAGDPEHKPISVIITTLTGLSYQGERSVVDALAGILKRMGSHIKYDSQGVAHIPNPTDPQENFADRWRSATEKRANFFKWLRKAQEDFGNVATQVNPERLVEAASQSFGARSAQAAGARGTRIVSLAGLYGKVSSLFTASHRQPAPWPPSRVGSVSISPASWTGKGFSRPTRLHSNGQPLMKGAALNFQAITNIPAPYEVFWQVVNTGAEAAAAGKLRGGFDAGSVERGGIMHREDATYAGSHTIECFIVKDRHLAARSGAFVVDVR
jgi:Adenylyl/Guanylyl and SMODS C-terminal sensor domain/Second Messenger Oligonucleotide or Dinucleotide Synthetase domain